MTRATGTPVSVASLNKDGRVSPAQVRVEVLDRKVADKGGAELLLRAASTDLSGPAGPVSLQLDLSGFVGAYGANWASRVRLMRMPQCFLTTPEVEGCATGEPVSGSLDERRNVLTADVDVDARTLRTVPPSAQQVLTEDQLVVSEPPVYALLGGTSSGTGDFSKTPLSQTSMWQAGSQGGDFNWSYPVPVPPVPGGLLPDVTLGYSSGGVDGRTASENEQSSVLGEGWDYQPGYIERTYRSCANDTDNTPVYTNQTSDLCWRLPNARMVLGGVSTELVFGSDNKWRAGNDNAAKVELLTHGAGVNFDSDGEYWRVTTVDGTQYYFGVNRLAGWQVGDKQTYGAWVVPVWANRTNEPCYDSGGFTVSWCNQAWRWNLDYVVDRHGNSMMLFWDRERQKVARAGNVNTVSDYDRGGRLTSIEYGLRAGTELDTVAKARVVFSYAERCLSSCWSGAAWNSAANAANWPDTPWDLQCTVNPCADANGPSFWQIRRMTGITTQIWTGSGTTYTDVDQWALTLLVPSTGNGTSPTFWLDEITRTGKVGGSVTMPSLKFGGTRLDQRADYNPNAGMSQPRKYRINQVKTEAGGQILVTYSGQQTGCHFGDTFPSPSQNTKRCFPRTVRPAHGRSGVVVVAQVRRGQGG